MHFTIFVTLIIVFALFYLHYFLIEKNKKLLPQSAGKGTSESLISKLFWGGHAPTPPLKAQALWALVYMALAHVLICYI